MLIAFTKFIKILLLNSYLLLYCANIAIYCLFINLNLQNMNQRFYALDVFRGMTVALMILVNTPGSWDFIYWPLDHAEWHGLTPTDLVFPFFLFAVGNAMAFVMPKLYEKGEANFWAKILKRTFIIFGIGLCLNWFPFLKWLDNDVLHTSELVGKPWSFTTLDGNKSGVRIFGVLQRIAVCYFFASVAVYYLKRKGAIIAAAILLLGYWALCYFANPNDPYSMQNWFGRALDLKILTWHHIYKGEKLPFDPEGIFSSFAAIAQVIIGYVIGSFVREKGNTKKTVEWLLIVGLILGFIGTIWGMYFPINKKIWTSSYTVLTCGMASMFIAFFIYLFEIVKLPQSFGKFFNAFGKNPLFIFVLSGALPRLLGLIRVHSVNPFHPEKGVRLTTPFNWFYENVIFPIHHSPYLTSFIYAVIMIIFYWLIAFVMDKKKIYVKV